MYNRYIPQPDGSYQKRRVADTIPKSPPIPQPPVHQENVKKGEEVAVHEQKQPQPVHNHYTANQGSAKNNDAGDFLRRLLPKGLDTGDLLIIVLLLLMSGDCQDEKNTAFLTLALYLFL